MYQWVTRPLAVFVIAGGLFFTIAAAPLSPQTVQDKLHEHDLTDQQLRSAQARTDERLALLEKQNIGERLMALETTLALIVWLLKILAVGTAAQVVIAISRICLDIYTRALLKHDDVQS